MREIKFRGKRKDNDEWIYGNYCLIAEEFVTEGINIKLKGCEFIPAIQIVKNNEYDCVDSISLPIKVYETTICQYTGLKDKNGVEIYEGDILKQPAFMCSDKLCRVFYDDIIGTGIGFQATEIPNGCDILSDEWDEFEVVGNVFDNPELLED